jgi:hypothetical protein
MEIFAEAFRELGTCRQIGFSIGPIPWLAVDAYCTRHGFDDEISADMFYIIRQVDDAYLEWVDAQSKKSTKQPLKSSTPAPAKRRRTPARRR